MDPISSTRRDRDLTPSDDDATLRKADEPRRTATDSRDVQVASVDDFFAKTPAADYRAAAANPSLQEGAKGVELLPLAKVPYSSYVDLTSKVHVGPYDLIPALRDRAGGGREVAFYVAHDRESHRDTWVVKPESLGFFRDHVDAYMVSGRISMLNGGPSREYQKEAMRMTGAIAGGQIEDAIDHLGQSMAEAVRDPLFAVDTLMAAASAIDPLARAAPELRLVPKGAIAPETATVAARSATVAERSIAAGARPMQAAPSITARAGTSALPMEGSAARAVPPVNAPVLVAKPAPLRLVASNAEVVKPPVLAPHAMGIVAKALHESTAAQARAAAVQPSVGVRGGENKAIACDPHPLGYHRGTDAIHNACADAVGPNLFPKSDFVVGGKSFDAVNQYRELFEVKTGYPSTYRGELPQLVWNKWTAEAEREGNVAAACGYQFVLAVADPKAVDALQEYFESNPKVEVRPADADECVR